MTGILSRRKLMGEAAATAFAGVAALSLVAGSAPDASAAEMRGGKKAPPPSGGATDDPPAPLRTVKVRSADTFGKALANAQPGDHIELATGTYTGDWVLARSGTAEAPIVIRSASKLGAVMVGTITLAGAFTGVYGQRFDSDALGVQHAAEDTFVLRCWFTGARGVRATSQKRVRIGYNRFSGGPVANLEGGHHVYFDIPLGSNDYLPEGGRVYRNAFASPSGSGADGEFRHIYIGDTGGRGEDETPSLTDFQITYNRIADSIRRRGIYTKRGGHVQFNHILGRGPGVTGIRHGGGGRFSGNRCDNINSVIINGPDHEVRGNWVRARLGLRLECEYTAASDSKYNAADRALVVGNDATLTVGYMPEAATLTRPVDGVQVYNHVGSVVLGQQTNTIWDTEPRPDMTYPTPVTLGPDDVGPHAP